MKYHPYSKNLTNSDAQTLYPEFTYGSYLATIGLEDKKFSLLADTGSAFTWFSVCDPLTMPECPSYYYDSLESKSLACSNETVYIQYGSGDV